MGRDLALDMGSANTLVYRQGEGIVFDQPCVVAVHAGNGEVLAMGEDAWQLIGGDSGNVVAVRPLRGGTMTEFDITQRMLEVVMRQVGVTRFPRPRVLVAVPSMASEVEKRAIRRRSGSPGCGRQRWWRSRSPRRSAPGSRSTSPWATSSSTSAAAARRWPWSRWVES